MSHLHKEPVTVHQRNACFFPHEHQKSRKICKNKESDTRSENGQSGEDTISFTQKVETWLEVGFILTLFDLSVVPTIRFPL